MLFHLLSLPYARKHALRSALNLAGIALGVAVWVAIHAANESAVQSLRSTAARIAGAAQLQVSAGRTGFPEEVLEKVQSAAEVRAAAPVIEAVVDPGIPGQGALLLLGVDLVGDSSLRRYDLESGDGGLLDDPLVFLAQTDSLIVTREFAARAGLGVGNRLPILTMQGRKQFTVRGVLRPAGPAQAFGGNLAVMDVYAAQAFLGRGRLFDRIDVVVRDGAPVESCRAALERLLGPGFQVEPPAARGRQFESILRAYTATMDLCSLFAVFMGMFIIYNSFAVAVVERRGEIGILRALGATQRQIGTLFAAESLVAGVAGSALGVALGALGASAMTRYVGIVLEGMYGVAQQVEAVSTSPRLLLTAMALGVATSLVAAWIPARNAARIDPVEALQKGRYQALSAGENRFRRAAAAALALLSAACLLLGRSKLAFHFGYVLLAPAALLLAPSLAAALARILRVALKRWRPIEGALAADSLLQSPRRTSATVAALMVSLALAIGMAGIARASYASILEWFHTTLDPDLIVATSANVATAAFRFPASLAGDLERIDGVARVQPVRSARIVLDGRTVLLYAMDMARRTARNAQDRETLRLAADGRGLLVSENLAEIRRLRPGDPLELATPKGVLRLPVLGTFRDYTEQQGTVLLDRRLFRDHWDDDTANVFWIYLDRGARPEDVKERILAVLGGGRRLFVLTNGDVRAYIERLTGQWFRVTYVQIAVAVLVAALGIVNALTVSIADRRRELGVLQAVGGLRRQVRYTLWIEALAVGAVGLALGFALGTVNLYYALEMVHRDITGMRFDYRFPFETALWLVPVILGAALLSALGPAESAVRAPLAEALEYE